MAVSTTKTPLTGLARMLVVNGLLSEQDAQQALQASLDNKVPLVNYLVEKKLVSSRDIAHAASVEFGVQLFDINILEIDPEVTKLVKEEIIRRHHALPIFKRGSRLFIAISDPTNLKALDEIRFHVGGTTEPILVEEEKLARVLDKAVEATDTGFAAWDDGGLEDLEGLDVGLEQPEQKSDDIDVDDAPVLKFVNKVLLDAIRKGASDLHFEPYEKYYRVRFRIDGVLSEMTKPPVALANKIAARIKVMSRLDVSERPVPQDGRIKLKIS